MIISIDGPAGSGKSTIAKILSKKLGFVHFNSGSLYRGITAFVVDKNIDVESFENYDFSTIKLEAKFIDNIQHVFVNGVDYTARLRDNEISILSPKVSVIKQVRSTVDACQKDFASKNNVIIDGRDIGSFVFPNADIKFYLDCSIKERAKRRFKEEIIKNPNITISEIEQQIAERDEFDKNKKIAPLVVPKNAIIIDSSLLSIEQVVDKMLENIKINKTKSF